MAASRWLWGTASSTSLDIEVMIGTIMIIRMKTPAIMLTP
jgi:ABC-type phosphate transport system auxiliary subunit